MKNFFIAVISLFSFSSMAITFEVINPCSLKFEVQENISILNTTNVSAITHYLLSYSNIDYVGDDVNILSIMKTPYSNDAFEVVNKNHYRSYGWCYEVDNMVPDVTMDKFVIDPMTHSKITWFYGYADLVNGKWINYCEPVYLHKHKFICN